MGPAEHGGFRLTEQPSGALLQRTEIVALHDRGAPPVDFGTLFVAGLTQNPKSLAGQMLLDRRSAAFERLCALPEYYIRRAELEILRDQASLIAQAVGPTAQLIDFGRGFSPQAAQLLSVLDQPWGYVAIDRERQRLLEDARKVQRLYPRLWVEAVCADMVHAFDLPSNAGGGRRLGYVPGGAIGNFDPPAALAAMSLWARELRPGGLLLVGVDLRKSVLIIESTYDDPHGFNAELTMDVLRRANLELGADFDIRLFDYRVQYDADTGRIDAELVAQGPHDVHLGEATVHFAAGEALQIEHSWKYSVEDFQALARGAGFRPLDMWLDSKKLFSVHLLAVG